MKYAFLLILFAVTTIVVSVFFIYKNQTTQLKANLIYVFQHAFLHQSESNAIHSTVRIRDGDETFCVSGTQEDTELIQEVVYSISNALNLSWSIIAREELQFCPHEQVSIYVYTDDFVNRSKLIDFFDSAEIPRPPDDIDFFSIPNTKGFTSQIPNGTSLAFIRNKQETEESHYQSVVIEELLQVILDADDVATDTLISIIAEDHSVADEYSRWFEKNPLGLCVIDLMLLEILLNPNHKHLQYYNQVYSYIRSNFVELRSDAHKLAAKLNHLRDNRC